MVPRRYTHVLARYLAPQRRSVALLAGLVLAGIGLQLVAPLVVAAFIDAAVAGTRSQFLLGMALGFVAVALVQQLVVVATTYVAERVAWTATNVLRADLALHCLRLDLGFHKDHTSGELIERIDGDVAALANFFSLFVLRIVGNLLLLVGVLVVLYWQDWRVGLGFTVVALLTLAVLISMRDLAVPWWEHARQRSADLFSFLEERLAGTEDIRANGAVGWVLQQFYDLMRGRYRVERRAAYINSLIVGARLALETLSLVLALVLGALLFGAGIISLGTVYLLVYYNRTLHAPLELIMDEIRDVQQAGASLQRITAVLQTPSRLVDGTGGALPAGPLGVEFRQVSFAYHDNAADTESPHDDPHAASSPDAQPPHRATPPVVLRDVSFRLAPGQVLGLLGRTGSGKTTLVRLIPRLYDPLSGAVVLNGIDVRTVPLAELRERVGVVTQDVQLFEGTVRDNLTFFDHAIPDSRLLQAIDQLGFQAWYASLVQGLDTPITSSGGGLSAGEAQILALVRIFLKNPNVVILDEASSRLDPHTEHVLERAIATLLAGRTGIIIAHRLSSVRQVQEIMILNDDGTIMEHDLRERLAANPDSHWSRLLRGGVGEVLA